MKAITKAKRRVTLSISGLGFLDESEVDSVPGARRPPPPPAPNVMEPPHDSETGEIIDDGSPPAPDTSSAATTASSPQFHAEDDEAVPEHELTLAEEARMAASHGRAAFEVLWKRLNYDERKSLNPIMDELGRLTREADAGGKS
jgi:hypothetical protein